MRLIAALKPVCLALVTVAGCAATPRDATYTVAVRNDAGVPVVLWLTKSGPPVEADWLSAAQWQILADKQLPGPLPAVTLPPLGVATLGPRTGRFGGSTRAVLEIYSTPATPQSMADAKNGDPGRARVDLQPGQNFVRVSQVAPVRAERTTAAALRPPTPAGVAREAFPQPETSP